MGDYPDPDEEYELMYADDLELLQDHEEDIEPNIVRKKPMPAKRSLDFSSPITKKLPVPPSSTSVESNGQLSQIQLTPDLQPMESLLTPVQTNKRTADELFGDINDIDFDTIELPSKRQKTEEENDLDLINKIVESRKLRQMLLEPSNTQRKVQPVFNYKDNLSLDIPRWAFMPLTNSDGDRVYVKLESEDAWDQCLDISTDHRNLHSLYIKTWEEARQMLERKLENEQIQQSQEFLPEVIVDVNSNNLWVEKYKPKSYKDLLSEEPVNRALLHWLHLWDKVVFKKEVKTAEPQQRNSFSKRTGQFQLSNNWRGKRDLEPELDEDGRPHHKVALLCGPPGVGKTTLAHLLARIAGYRPVELNASDERSTEAFRTALQNATLMRSVLDADKRPNCLILDEIDGAPLPTVELLVKWCTVAVAEGKKKTKSQPLKRPVIAICNDLYATSLRPLRPVALVVQVGGVSLSRLSSRLSRVAASENIAAAPHVLAALAARARGDVRAALHALHFTGRAQLKMEDVEKLSIGDNDCSKSLMQALVAIFTAGGRDIMKTIQAAGEYDRLMDGIFENYMSARVDSRLRLACETLSWLRLYDLVQAWTQRGQNYSLYGLMPMCIARCHTLLATKAPTKLKFPMQAQEVYKKKNEIESIVRSVLRGSAPSVLLTMTPLRLDLIPMLPYLLSPTLRSANVQLCSEWERGCVRTIAAAMCDYGLQYLQQRTADSLYAFVLEPDIYRAAFIGNEEKVKPPPPVRQAIAREQQLEAIRRNELMPWCPQRLDVGEGIEIVENIQEMDMVEPQGATSCALFPQSSQDFTNRTNKNKPGTTEAKSKDHKKSSTVAAKEVRIPNHLQRLQPKEVVKAAPQVHKDFFGRIVPLSQVQRSDAVPDVISSANVFYQYREGFNNAVRRNVRMRDLL